jgi:hypothetical protein
MNTQLFPYRYDARFAAMWLPLGVIPGRDGGRNSSSASDIESSSSRHAPTPSVTATAAMASAATGSADDEPTTASGTRPPSRAADSHAQSNVSHESARNVGKADDAKGGDQVAVASIACSISFTKRAL